MINKEEKIKEYLQSVDLAAFLTYYIPSLSLNPKFTLEEIKKIYPSQKLDSYPEKLQHHMLEVAKEIIKNNWVKDFLIEIINSDDISLSIVTKAKGYLDILNN